MIGENTSQRIVFGNEFGHPREVISSTDILVVDPSLFAGVEQRDSHSCAYLALEALVRMQKDSRRQSERSDPNDLIQLKLIRSIGLGRLTASTYPNTTAQLPYAQFKEMLFNDASPEGEVITSRADREDQWLDATLAEMIGDAVRSGMAVALEMNREHHVVLVIGVSHDGRECICWDALSGHPDVNYPNSRLRRIKLDTPDAYMWGGLKISELFTISQGRAQKKIQTSTSSSRGGSLDQRVVTESLPNRPSTNTEQLDYSAIVLTRLKDGTRLNSQQVAEVASLLRRRLAGEKLRNSESAVLGGLKRVEIQELEALISQSLTDAEAKYQVAEREPTRAQQEQSLEIGTPLKLEPQYDDDWVLAEVRQLSDIFARKKVDTPIRLMTHLCQPDGSTCVAASMANALNALGSRGRKNIDSLLEEAMALNLRPPFSFNAVYAWADNRNLVRQDTDRLIEIVRWLDFGGVALIIDSSAFHAYLITGFQSDGQGNMMFRVNDPLTAKATFWTPELVAKAIKNTKWHIAESNARAVGKPTKKPTRHDTAVTLIRNR